MPICRPVRATREVGGVRYEASYLADEIRITTVAADGTATTKSLKPVADGIDNDASLASSARAAPGCRVRDALHRRDPDHRPDRAGPADRDRRGDRHGAGRRVRHLAGRDELRQRQTRCVVWPGCAVSARKVRQPVVGRRVRAELARRRARPRRAPALTPTPAAATAATTEASSAAVPINIPLLLTTFLVQMPLMILFPILLGWWIRRKYGIGWGVFGIGAATFVASQVVHIPLNYALGLLGGGRGVATVAADPAGAGGRVERGRLRGGRPVDRAAFLRAKKTRGWRAGLQFGAGHGGAEAIILGLLALVNVVGLLVVRSLGAAALGLPAEAASQMQAAQASYWSTNGRAAAGRRPGASRCHRAANQHGPAGDARGDPAQSGLAAGGHRAAHRDRLLGRVGHADSGDAWTEVGLAPLAAFAVWLIWRLREAPPAAEPEPAPRPDPAGGPSDAACALAGGTGTAGRGVEVRMSGMRYAERYGCEWVIWSLRPMAYVVTAARITHHAHVSRITRFL